MGVVLYNKNGLKAPNNVQTHEMQNTTLFKGWDGGNKILDPGEVLPHDLVLVTTTIGQECTPSGRTMGLARLGNPAEFG